MRKNNDKLVTIFEAAKELNISVFKFLRIVNPLTLIGLQSLLFGANIFLPHSEVLKLKSKIQ